MATGNPTIDALVTSESQLPPLSEADLLRKAPAIKVNGAVRELSLRELTEWATKAMGADEKFREAASFSQRIKDLEAENKELKGMASDFEALKSNGDPNAFLRMAQRAGYDYEAANKMWLALNDEAPEPSATPAPKGNGAPVKPSFADLPPEVQAAVKYVANLANSGVDIAHFSKLGASDLEERAGQTAKQRIAAALDKNEKLRTIVGRKGEARERFINRVFADLSGRVEKGQTFDTALGGAVNDAAELLGAVVQNVATREQEAGLFGLGPAPASGRGFRLEAPQQPKIDEKRLFEKGSIAALADAVVAYDKHNSTEGGYEE